MQQQKAECFRLLQLSIRIATVISLNLSLYQLCELTAAIGKCQHIESAFHIINESGVIEFLMRSFELSGDCVGGARRDILIRMFEGHDIDRRLPVQSNVLSQLSRHLMRCRTSEEVLRIFVAIENIFCRRLYSDPDFSLAVKVDTLANLLAYAETAANSLFPRVPVVSDDIIIRFDSPADSGFGQCLTAVLYLCTVGDNAPPYAATSGFLVLLRHVLRCFLEGHRKNSEHSIESFSSLLIDSVCSCLIVLVGYHRDPSAFDARAADARALALSPEFDLVLKTINLKSSSHLTFLCICLDKLSDNEIASVFSAQHAEILSQSCFTTPPSDSWSDDDLARFSAIVDRIGRCAPALATQLVFGTGGDVLDEFDVSKYGHELDVSDDNDDHNDDSVTDNEDSDRGRCNLLSNAAHLFDALLATATDRVRMTQAMHNKGAHLYCLRLLALTTRNSGTLASSKKCISGDTVTALLRVLRTMIENSDPLTLSDAADGNKTAGHVAADFISHHGEQLLAELQDAECCTQGSSAQDQLTQLRSLL